MLAKSPSQVTSVCRCCQHLWFPPPEIWYQAGVTTSARRQHSTFPNEESESTLVFLVSAELRRLISGAWRVNTVHQSDALYVCVTTVFRLLCCSGLLVAEGSCRRNTVTIKWNNLANVSTVYIWGWGVASFEFTGIPDISRWLLSKAARCQPAPVSCQCCKLLT